MEQHAVPARAGVTERLAAVRAETSRRAATLSAEDQCVQSLWLSCDPSPRFRPPAGAGAVGEYSGTFTVGEEVLRGRSVATPLGHTRATYRNFFPPAARWQFSGLRLAKDGT